MSEFKCKILAGKKGGYKSKMAAKLFALANSLNKHRRELKKKRKQSNILFLHTFCFFISNPVAEG